MPIDVWTTGDVAPRRNRDRDLDVIEGVVEFIGSDKLIGNIQCSRCAQGRITPHDVISGIRRRSKSQLWTSLVLSPLGHRLMTSTPAGVPDQIRTANDGASITPGVSS